MALGFLNSKVHQCEFQLWLCKDQDFVQTLKQLREDNRIKAHSPKPGHSLAKTPFPYPKNVRI